MTTPSTSTPVPSVTAEKTGHPTTTTTTTKAKVAGKRTVAEAKAATGAISPRPEALAAAAAAAAAAQDKKKKTAKAAKSPKEQEAPLTDAENKALEGNIETFGKVLTTFTNSFKEAHDTNLATVTTVYAVDFPKRGITEKTHCFVCTATMHDVCADVLCVSQAGEHDYFVHPECIGCTHLVTADECCRQSTVRVIKPGAAPLNEKGKDELRVVHLSDLRKPVCKLHLSDKYLAVPTFDPKTQTKELQNFLARWGFVKTKTALTPEQCKAEAERLPMVVCMMNGVDEKTARVKMQESNWDARLDWCEKERGFMGIVSDSKPIEGMPPEINKLLANGIRADPILSKEAFTVRASTTDSLLPVFPKTCNAQNNIMTDFGQYVLIPKESFKMSAHRQLQCFSSEKRLRQSEKRANSLQSVHGIVFFGETGAEQGGISVLVCPEEWKPSRNSDLKCSFSDKMDEITPRAPNYGLFAKDHPFSGLPVPIPTKAGEAVLFRMARPFALLAGSNNVTGMVIGATDMIPKKATWVHRANAVIERVLPKKDSNRSGVKYPAKINSPYTADSPTDWAGYFSPVKEVHVYAREIMGTGYTDPLGWPVEYRPKARTFAVTSPVAKVVKGAAASAAPSPIANKDEEEMEAIVEEENADETAQPVAAAAPKPSGKPVNGAAAKAKAKPAAAAVTKAKAAPAKATTTTTTTPKKKAATAEERAEDEVYQGVTGEPSLLESESELDIEEEKEEKKTPTPKDKKKPASASASKKAKAEAAEKKAELMSPSSDKTAERPEDEVLTMRMADELKMREGFFEQDDPADVTAGFTSYVRKNGGDQKLVFDVVEAAAEGAGRGVQTVFSRGTSLTAFALDALTDEQLNALSGDVDALTQLERTPLKVAGKDTIPGKVQRLYGAPLHWNKIHAEPEPETPEYVQATMDWLNTTRQPEDMEKINQCLFMVLSRKADFVKEMHRTEDIHEGSMLHLVFLGNESRTIRFRSTRPPEGKEKGLGAIFLDLNVVSGMCYTLSPEFCDDEKGMTYEVLRLPDAGKSEKTSEPDCEPLCVMAFYACAPVSLRANGKPKNGSKYQRTKPKPKKAKTEAAASSSSAPTPSSAMLGVKMAKATPLLGGKTHDETLAEFKAFVAEHKAAINDKKNAKTLVPLIESAKKAGTASHKGKANGTGLGDFQRAFSALHKAVTGEDWDAGPLPQDDEANDDEEELDLGFEPMDIDDEEEPQPPAPSTVTKKKKKTAVVSVVPAAAAAAKAKPAPKAKGKGKTAAAAAADDMQVEPQSPAAPVEPGSLFEVPQETRKHVLTKTGEVARRSARPKSGPVKSKADIIAEEQNELAKKQWLANEKIRAKKGLPKQSFAAYKATLITGSGKGAAKGTFIGESKGKRARDDEDEDDDEDEVHFESNSDSDSDAGGDSSDEDDDMEDEHVDTGALLAKYIETLDALYSGHQKKLDGPKKDKKLFALYEKAEEAKEKCEEALSEEALAIFRVAVRVLGEGLGVDVLGEQEEEDDDEDGDHEEEEAPAAEKRKKQVVDLTGATVYNQGWNATLDPEGAESGRFIAAALETLQVFLAKDESESAEVIALLDSTIQLLNTPPSAGLTIKAMSEFMRLAKRLVKKLNSKGGTDQAPPLIEDKAQQQISFPVRKKQPQQPEAPPAVPAKDKEEQPEEPLDEEEPAQAEAEEQQQEAAPAADDGEAKPMDTGMEEDDAEVPQAAADEEEEEEQQQPQEDEEEDGVPALDEEEAAADEVEPIKANDEESDTGGSDVEDAEAPEQEAQEQEAEADEGLEGSAGEATKDKIPAARPDQEEELVDENPSPSATSAQQQKKKREREEPAPEQDADDEEDENLVVVEEPAAPSPSKKAAVQQQKPQQQAPLIAAVIQNRRIHSVYESEAAARVGISNAFTPKAGQTIDNYCTFRPLPSHWKSFLQVKMALEPVVENLPKIENIAMLWPDLAPPAKK